VSLKTAATVVAICNATNSAAGLCIDSALLAKRIIERFYR
jgi:hypothetical protein